MLEMDYVRCGTCNQRRNSIEDAYVHSNQFHPDTSFKIYKPILCHESGKKKYVSEDFKFNPVGDITDLEFVDEGLIRKKQTNSEPSSSKEDANSALDETEVNIDKALLQELTDLFPKVVSSIKKHGDLEIWTEFFRLINEGKFPLENIAYKLFLDVVQWHSLSDKTKMRYSSEVKTFWAIVYRIFKGHFTAFMRGGGDNSEAVNFALPAVTKLLLRNKKKRQRELDECM